MAITSNMHHAAPKDNCLDVPPELWFAIMMEMEAKDILSLCFTCRSLHILLSERIVWILILRCVCREDELYFPSYDVDNMDVKDLRRAAMGRYNWGQLLKQNFLQTTPEESSNPPVLMPASEPLTLPSTMTIGELENGGKDSVFYLIPGGRYLVLVALPSLKLLDLGVPGKRPLATPHELAKVELGALGKPAHGVWLLAWEHDSGSIRVVVGVDHESSSTTTVYSVLPTEVCPSFRTLGAVQVVPERQISLRIRVHRNLVYIAGHPEGGLGIVWDFENGRYTLVPLFLSEHYLIQDVFTGDFIIYFNSAHIVLWRVPYLDIEVPPDGRINVPRSFYSPPKDMICHYPLEYAATEPRPMSVRVPSHPHMTFPIILEISIMPTEGSSRLTRRYSADFTRGAVASPDSQLNATFSLQTTYSLPPYFSTLCTLNDLSHFDLGYSSRDLRFLGRTTAHVVFILSVFPARTSRSCQLAGNPAALTVLHSDSEDAIIEGSLCSASGRFVYLIERNREWEMEVRVVDYLSRYPDGDATNPPGR